MITYFPNSGRRNGACHLQLMALRVAPTANYVNHCAHRKGQGPRKEKRSETREEREEGSLRPRWTKPPQPNTPRALRTQQPLLTAVAVCWCYFIPGTWYLVSYFRLQQGPLIRHPSPAEGGRLASQRLALLELLDQHIDHCCSPHRLQTPLVQCFL